MKGSSRYGRRPASGPGSGPGRLRCSHGYWWQHERRRSGHCSCRECTNGDYCLLFNRRKIFITIIMGHGDIPPCTVATSADSLSANCPGRAGGVGEHSAPTTGSPKTTAVQEGCDITPITDPRPNRQRNGIPCRNPNRRIQTARDQNHLATSVPTAEPGLPRVAGIARDAERRCVRGALRENNSAERAASGGCHT